VFHFPFVGPWILNEVVAELFQEIIYDSFKHFTFSLNGQSSTFLLHFPHILMGLTRYPFFGQYGHDLITSPGAKASPPF